MADYRIIYEPWSDAMVEALNARQGLADVHPYACDTEGCEGILWARRDGWHCTGCGYRQYWALAIPTQPPRERER